MISRLPLIGITALVAAGFCVGCSGSGSTDDSGDGVTGTQFVPTDGAAGSIRVSVNDSTIRVGGVVSFSAQVFDSTGARVPDIKVVCDSEEGLAITEPTTGTEITGSDGGISGSVGCASIGTFVFGCRAANLGKREFVTVVCSGPVPTGFDGFPGAGGGGLGAGGSDGGTTGGTGGTNPDGVRVTSVSFDDAGTGEFTDVQIDTEQGVCDATSDPIVVEPFFDTRFKAKIVNDSNQAMTFTKFSYSIPALGYSSARRSFTDIGEIGTVAPEGGELSVKGFLVEARNSVKYFPDTATTVQRDIGATEVKFRFYGTNDNGDSVVLTASVEPSFSNYDRCD